MSEQPRLSKEQHGLVLYTEQYYWRTSSMPTYNPDTCPKELWDKSWADAKFLDALAARGIPEHLLRPDTGDATFHVLTEQQMAVANVLLDVLDSRSRIKKLTEMGISTQQYNLWLRDPVYRQYCLDRAESLLIENQPVAHMSLINRVAQGDLGAVKYFNAMTGRYREREKAAVEINTTNVFGGDQLIAIIEIIQRHVKDPATLELIGQEILELNAAPDSHQRRQGLSGPSVYNGEIYSKVGEALDARPI